MPLQSLRNYSIIYNGSPKSKALPVPGHTNSSSPAKVSRENSPAETKTPQEVSKSASPMRRSRSMSPVKEYTSPASGGAPGVVLSAGTPSVHGEEALVHTNSDPPVRRSKMARNSIGLPPRGLAPKATSTIPGPGFRKSTFPSLVDGTALTTKSAGSAPSDLVRFKMTHAGYHKQNKGRNRSVEPGKEDAGKFNRGS